jgi:hypothetical protein
MLVPARPCQHASRAFTALAYDEATGGCRAGHTRVSLGTAPACRVAASVHKRLDRSALGGELAAVMGEKSAKELHLFLHTKAPVA